MLLKKMDTYMQNRNEVGPLCSTIYTKINSKWAIDLNMRGKTIQFLEENIGQSLHNTGVGDGILNMTQRHKKQEEKRRQIHFRKMKNVCVPKEA